MKLLSIIIPSYRRKMELKRLLETILQCGLDREDYEIVVSDDSPAGEEVVDIVAQYTDEADIKYHKNEIGYKGPGANRQNGMNLSCGKWLLFIDDDDGIVADSLGRIKPYLYRTDVSYIKTWHLTWEEDETYHWEDPYELLHTLTHGKIYYRPFLEKHKIQYNYQDFGNEDIYFNYWVLAATGADPKYEELFLEEYSQCFYLFRRNPYSLSRSEGFTTKAMYHNLPNFLSKFINPFSLIPKMTIGEKLNMFNIVKNELCFATIVYVWGLKKSEVAAADAIAYNNFFNSWKECFYKICPEENMVETALQVAYECGVNNFNDIYLYLSMIASTMF